MFFPWEYQVVLTSIDDSRLIYTIRIDHCRFYKYMEVGNQSICWGFFRPLDLSVVDEGWLHAGERHHKLLLLEIIREIFNNGDRIMKMNCCRKMLITLLYFAYITTNFQQWEFLVMAWIVSAKKASEWRMHDFITFLHNGPFNVLVTKVESCRKQKRLISLCDVKSCFFWVHFFALDCWFFYWWLIVDWGFPWKRFSWNFLCKLHAIVIKFCSTMD